VTETASESRSQSAPRRRRWIVIVAVVALGGAAVLGVSRVRDALRYESTDDAFLEGHVVPVSARVDGRVREVLAGDNERVEAGALLVELDPADFQAAVDAAHASLAAAEAARDEAAAQVTVARVTSDAGLARADAEVEVASTVVATAKLALATATARVAEAQGGLAAARAALDEEKAAVGASEAAAARDRTDLERARATFEKGAATREVLDHAIAAAKVSEADLETARRRVAVAEAALAQGEAAVRTAKDAEAEARSRVPQAEAALAVARANRAAAEAGPATVKLREAQARAAEAMVAHARAALDEAELRLGYTRVVAPTAGRVTRKGVEAGQSVETGQTLLLLVPDEVWVVANFKETQLTRMRVGQPVVLHVDAYPDVTWRGHVDSLQAGTGARFSLLPPENATGNFVKVVQRVPVKIVFDEPPDRERYLLAPGMSVVPDVDVTGEGGEQR
jgi:membrane fusion protein (multidrug efflux system)